MKDIRVRAIAVTNQKNFIAIERVRPNTETYWVFPGGGVEDKDSKILEQALQRELIEEMNAEIEQILYPTYCITRIKDNNILQYEIYFLVKIKNYSDKNRTGPEFETSESGEYNLVEIPLTAIGISKMNIKPDEVKQFMINVLESNEEFPEIDISFVFEK